MMHFSHTSEIKLHKNSQHGSPNLLRAILLLLLGACQPDEAASNTAGNTTRPISVCASAEAPLQLPASYAYEKGLFDRHGLQAEIVRLPNGSTAATTMLVGEVGACQIPASNIINRGTATYTSLVTALQHLGLEPDTDVAVISARSFSEIMDAFTSGAMDGAIRIEERPDDAQNLMRAITHAIYEMQRDPEDTKEVLIGLTIGDVVDTSIMASLQTSGFLESLEELLYALTAVDGDLAR